VSCYHCHLGGPSGGKHPSGWGNPQENHEEYFESNGKNATACAQKYCHGTDLKGGSAPPNGSWSKGPSCYTCHGKEWKIP
jgi:hypothetical protein